MRECESNSFVHKFRRLQPRGYVNATYSVVSNCVIDILLDLLEQVEANGMGMGWGRAKGADHLP